jgi:transcriptional regulator with XRE-family HTH domain
MKVAVRKFLCYPIGEKRGDKTLNEQRISNTAERLRDIMGKRGLKQVDILNMCKPLCEQFGEKINKSHLSQWLNGINEPSQNKLTILSLALGVSEPWLIGYDVSPRLVKGDPFVMPMFPGSDIFDESTTKPLLMEGISRLTEEEAQKLLDVARAIFPGRFEWSE